MNKNSLRRAVCLVLTAALLLTLCACGNTAGSEEGPIVHKNIADYCYIGQENNSTAYTCTVTDRNGFTLFHKEGMPQPPKTEAVGENLLKVYYQPGNLAQGSWAIYCNVETSQTSPLFTNVLTTKGIYVVYTDYLTEAHQIFVRDAMDENAYFESVTLADADKGEAVLGGVTNEDGDLNVIYLCEGKEKTAVVKMPKE